MWLVVRVFVLFAAGVLVMERIPAAALLVAVVVFFRYLDSRRRNEFLLLQNFGISRAYPVSITVATAGFLETAAWIYLA